MRRRAPADDIHVTNIRETPFGFQAYFKHRGKYRSHRSKDRAEVESWLRRERVLAEFDIPSPDTTTPRQPTFEYDAAQYLGSVLTMPSIADRRLHINEWADVFAGRDRNSVTPIEIKTQLERWRSRLSESSCNKRRTALMAFYTAMNGKSGYNPVRDVPKYHEDEEPRSRHPLTILRVLSFMGPTKTRARLRVMWATGWPHAQIKKLKEEHRVYWKQGRAFVTPRRKGRGHKGVWLPLLPQAVTALEEFHTANAYGSFSNSAARKAWRLALSKLNAHRAKLGLPALSIRPYDIRHTFLTFIAKRTKDDRVVQELGLHSRPEQSQRYSREATELRVSEALAAISGNRGNFDAGKGSTRLDSAGEKKQRRPKK